MPLRYRWIVLNDYDFENKPLKRPTREPTACPMMFPVIKPVKGVTTGQHPNAGYAGGNGIGGNPQPGNPIKLPEYNDGGTFL